jgi:class 3 adenylate cyclase
MERKLTAIVAADVVNYSILIGKNELGTIAALHAMQNEVLAPLSSKYNGRIVRVMGDGSLLAFNSALDAVQFAVDVQGVMAERKTANAEVPIEIRMGVNLCDIILEAHDIHGEGVNVAVRLEELAPPGGICLSQSIYLQTKNVLGGQLLPIGERQLKNISEPVQVWRWQPPGVVSGVGVNAEVVTSKKHYHGRQILDPKVTAIIVDLHMRSTRLAVSDCLDEILATPDGGHSMSLEEIYKRFGHHINHARGFLRSISVEFVDNIHEFTSGLWQTPQSMSEFMTVAFENADTSYSARFLPQVRNVLGSGLSIHEKRAELSTLVGAFVHDNWAPRIKAMIKFAFVEP